MMVPLRGDSDLFAVGELLNFSLFTIHDSFKTELFI